MSMKLATRLRRYQTQAHKWSVEWSRRAQSGASRRQVTAARKRFIDYSIKAHQVSIDILRGLP